MHDPAVHLQYVRESAWEALYPGFAAKSRVVTDMRELVEYDDECPVDPDEAERVVEELWARRRAELATAPPRTPTDDQRLDGAFADLRAAGLVAVMCCGYDQGEAHDECRAAAAEGGEWGFVFFHHQDADRLSHGDVLYLGYDAVRPPPDGTPDHDRARRRIGELIVAALTRHGLRSTWNGSSTTRIAVPDIDWRRPLPDDDPSDHYGDQPNG